MPNSSTKCGMNLNLSWDLISSKEVSESTHSSSVDTVNMILMNVSIASWILWERIYTEKVKNPMFLRLNVKANNRKKLQKKLGISICWEMNQSLLTSFTVNLRALYVVSNVIEFLSLLIPWWQCYFPSLLQKKKSNFSTFLIIFCQDTAIGVQNWNLEILKLSVHSEMKSKIYSNSTDQTIL